MRILLLGEYSNVHNTLAKGLRELGHEVTVASNGDFWKDFPRDIDLSREMTPWGTLSFMCRLMMALPKMRGYDIVQLINPLFLELKAEKLFSVYNYLRKHNRRLVLCCMGNDYYYPMINSTLMPMHYSDYNIGKEKRCVPYAQEMYEEWVGTEKERLNRYIAKDCDALIAGAYEYWLPLSMTEDKGRDGKLLREKLYSVPFPYEPKEIIKPKEHKEANPQTFPPTGGLGMGDNKTSPLTEALGMGAGKTSPLTGGLGGLSVFIGVSRNRSEFKGTDIMLQAARDLEAKYPDKMVLRVAEGVPFAEYQKMMDSSDVVMDQIYAYGPGMNALLALSKGIVCMTGAEPEHYALIGEKECRPIINVQPSYDSVYAELERLILMPKEELQRLKEASREYVMRNHHYVKIAHQYENIYQRLLQ